MSAASLPVPVPRPLARSLAPAKLAFEKVLLYEVLALLLPSWALTAGGMPSAGATWYYGLLSWLLLWHWAHRRPHRVSGLLLATLPAMDAFRSYFLYHSPEFFHLAALLLWFAFRRKDARDMLRDRLLIGLIVFTVLYWWISFVTTGDYGANLRALELSLSVAGCTLLYSEQSAFRTALLCVGVSLLAQGAAVGFAATGVPAALLFLLSVAGNGRWILLTDRPVGRAMLAALSGLALLLSMSPGAWMVAVAGLVVILIFDRTQRVFATLCLVALMAAMAGYADLGLAPHPLFPQLSAELGPIGLGLLAVFAFFLFRRAWFYQRTFQEPAPLMAAVAYLTAGLTVPAPDAASGMFLTLSLLRLRRNVFRIAKVPAGADSKPRPLIGGEVEP